MYRRLTIDGTVVDLPQSGLTYSLVYEVSDEGFISGAYSKRSIELPSTGTNDALFEDWYAAGTANTLTAPVLKSFVFEDGGIQILSGQAELQSALLMSDRYRFKGRNYKVDLYGTNADWTIRLKDLAIRDLDFTPAILDHATVVTGWTAQYDLSDYFGFTLIKWKEWNTAGQVGIDEFTPFLFIRSIIDKAFDTIGYTLQSDFMDSDVFKRLILPCPMAERYPEEFSQDYINVDLEEPGTNVASTSNTYVFPNVVQPNLATPYNAVTGFFVAPFTGYYEVQISATVTSTVGTWGAYFSATVNSGTIPITNSEVPFANDILAPPQAGNATGAAISDVVYLQAGDTISLLHVFAGSDPSTTFAFTMQIRGEAEYAFGSILDFRYLVKDWKVIDLIKGLQHMFNLRFEANPQAGTLRIEPADPYLYRQYNAPTNVAQEVREGFYQAPTEDNTQALDLEPEAELFNINDLPRYTIFDYITDGESEEARETNEPIGIYASKYTLPQGRFNEATQENENPFFAKTIHTIDAEIQGTAATTALQIPLIYPQNYEQDPTATEINPDIQARILYFVGFRGLPSDSLVKYAFTGGVELSPPLSFMVNYNQPLEFSLSFATETIQGEQVPGLFEAFWMQEYARKRIGKTLEAYYFWDLLTINSLTFRNKLLIDGSEWILQKIDGYSAQSDSSTKTVFVLEQGPTSDDITATEYSGILGIINPISL
jgi:hypothetical protein